MSIRKKLSMMEDINRRNDDRIERDAALEFIEKHMRKRLAEIRAKDVPAEVEPVRLQIIERYERDLATWVG